MATQLLHYKNITLDKVLQETDMPRKTKIVCTIGPACQSVDKLVELIDAGMNIARLNFSHGSHESHRQTLANLREAKKIRPDSLVAILLDTKGPEIRTGLLKNQQPVTLNKGDLVEIVTDYSYLGDEKCFACSYEKLPQSVKEGDIILAADGSLVMKVVKIKEKGVIVKMVSGGILGEKKNMNLPGNKVDLPTVTEKDHTDLRAFAADIDFVAASFVQSAADIETIRTSLGSEGKNVKVVAKIENQEGLHNFDEILRATDAVMIARGDLGMEIPMEKVFLAQKMLIRKCNVLGKPVITATQMLESMTKNPRPTRAESTDVANAVLDGTDCVMLSGETASGDYPTESVQTIAAICREAESVINHDKLFGALANSIRYEGDTARSDKTLELTETIASSTVKAQIDSNASLIIIISENAKAARLVAKYRPKSVVLMLTGNEQIARQLNGIVYAVHVHCVDRKLTVQTVLNKGLNIGKQNKWIKPGDYFVVLKRVKRKDSFRHLMEVNVVPDDDDI